MAEPHVVTALVAKRAELAGEIKATEQRILQMRADLHHIDAAIRLFVPDYPVEEIQPKFLQARNEWFKRHEGARVVLDILRRASGPMTARDIAAQIMQERGLNPGDANALRLVAKTVQNTLARRKDGLVSGHRTREGMTWSLAK